MSINKSKSKPKLKSNHKLSKTSISRYIKKSKKNNKIYNNSIKKSNKSNKTIKLRKKLNQPRKGIVRFIGGGNEILNYQSFYNRLSNNQKNKILEKLNQNNLANLNLQDIINNYKTKQSYNLYDFIFDKSSSNPRLLKIWDHKTNDPNSITAGLPGIHIYVIIDSRYINKFEIIGKFIR